MTDFFSQTGEPKSFARRDSLIEIQNRYQKIWHQEKLYEQNAPQNIENKEKYMVTFPYPYMNGKLHLGHAFSLTKSEFAARFQRMRGKHVLFPFAYHCTGMPISASAKKLKIELDTFGNPPNFPSTDAEKKVVRQYNILKDMGIPAEDIPRFCDPIFWLTFFPPLAQDDLKRFGTAIDHRRSFITTDVNPFYDRFICWQFEQLKEKDLVGFGERYTIFSPSDNQPCADHDRATGEGVKPKDFTVIKLKVKEPYPKCLSEFSDKNVYLGAATLRPETMYGQTNCWLKPDGEYGLFELKNGELFVLTERAAYNFSFQGYSPEGRGKVKCLAKFKGEDLFGCGLSAPYSVYDTIYVLPMMNVDTAKTTGVVTSVPSDSPDDFAAYQDLRNKEGLRNKFGITSEHVGHEMIPIIDVPELGKVSAETLCKKYNVKSQNDKEKLQLAHDEAYKLGFAHGVLIVGDFAGKPVKEAKDLIRDELIKEGLAIPYSEPEERVVSRSGDECVVALTDQWYIKYGEENWKNNLKSYLKTQFKYYNNDTFNDLLETVDWLREWGCSRDFGLGSKMPWDQKFLIESLSDSTIYMAYYTVAHLLQSSLNGQSSGSMNIKPEQLTREVLDYIFHDREFPQDCGISQENLDKLRNEFRYWYPVDLRVSAKDLIKNHLTMFLYNHMAIWDQKYMPRSIFANGYVMVDGQKMSKSLGNFLTVEQVVGEFGTDAVRLALADAGDSHGDANFERHTANAAILKLTTFISWVEDALKSQKENAPFKIRQGEKQYIDRIFESRMNFCVKQCFEAFDRMYFKEGLTHGWFVLQNVQHEYQAQCDDLGIGMHSDLISEFIHNQVFVMSPICPHTMDHIWRDVLKQQGSVCDQSFPTPSESSINKELLSEYSYFEQSLRNWRQRLSKDQNALKKKGVTPNVAHIYVADSYVDWQEKALGALRNVYNEDGHLKDMSKVAAQLKPLGFGKKQMQSVMAFVAMKRKEVETEGLSAIQDRLSFDGHTILQVFSPYISKQFNMEKIFIHKTSDENLPDPMNRASSAVPGKPSIAFDAA